MTNPPENKAIGPTANRATCSHRDTFERARSSWVDHSGRMVISREIQCRTCGAVFRAPGRSDA